MRKAIANRMRNTRQNWGVGGKTAPLSNGWGTMVDVIMGALPSSSRAARNTQGAECHEQKQASEVEGN